MRNEEFDVVRDLLAGRAPEGPEYSFTGHVLAPASFREIDGEILARQYVAHRKFLETEAMAQRFGEAEGRPDSIRSAKLRAGRRPAATTDAEDPMAAGRASWFSALGRLFWRR